MLKLRGHHLVCLHYFQGKGYSQEFIRNLQELVGRAQEGEPVEVVAGPDDVCRACLNLRKERCRHKNDAEAEIKKLDCRALCYLGASVGERATWEKSKTRSAPLPKSGFPLFAQVATGGWFVRAEDKPK